MMLVEHPAHIREATAKGEERYLAHKNGKREQTVWEHLSGTARLAEGFAAAFGAGDDGRFCGILHDVGKYTKKFQERLNGSPEWVDHSTAGALEAARRRNVPAAFCIAGHHGGLPDRGSEADTPDDATLKGRLKRIPGKNIEDYSAFAAEVKDVGAVPPQKLCRDAESAMFYIRMLFSCLVDADWLDTESFMSNGGIKRDNFPPLSVYREKLREKTAPWLASPDGELNGLRNEILRAAITAGKSRRGLFTFTAPTGSGKTISSMSFAAEHAAANGMERIIYVIPYCSIIEQTLSEFEKIFGAGSVVAHYSDAEFRSDENGVDKRYLASENWDAPVILTTTVQFFESLYARSPSKCRKLHNIAGSVIIFDEAQMLPASFLHPCVDVIARLVEDYKCTAVLCTATQPALGKLFEMTAAGASIREICPHPEEMYEAFRRVRYENIGEVSDAALAQRLSEHKQALCIVNRRDQAQELLAALPGEGSFHLSTAMCPADRRKRVDEIRSKLDNGETCRVVSTSIVECGMDLDFPVVYRALAGLDSVVQAGGRCNREGKRPLADSVVKVFESERAAPRMLGQNISAARYAMSRYPDPASPEAVSSYFHELYYGEKGMNALDAAGILGLCGSGDFPFKETAESFHIIDDSQYTVYIPKPENTELIYKLEHSGPDRELMRSLGQYAVGAYPQYYKALGAALIPIPGMNGASILGDMRLYSDETGLVMNAERGGAAF